MANLLSNASNWRGVFGEGPPPDSWNGTSYVAQSAQWSEGRFGLELLPSAAAVGGTVDGTMDFYNSAYGEPPLPAVLVLRYNGDYQEMLELTPYGPNNFSFTVPAGASGVQLLVADYPGASSPTGFYGIEVELRVASSLVANDDYSEAAVGSSVTTDVLANDTVDGEPVPLLMLEGVPVITRHPAHGTVSVAGDGSITYTPDPGTEATEDSYEYEIALHGTESNCTRIAGSSTSGSNDRFLWPDDFSNLPPWFDSDADFWIEMNRIGGFQYSRVGAYYEMVSDTSAFYGPANGAGTLYQDFDGDQQSVCLIWSIPSGV